MRATGGHACGVEVRAGGGGGLGNILVEDAEEDDGNARVEDVVDLNVDREEEALLQM